MAGIFLNQNEYEAETNKNVKTMKRTKTLLFIGTFLLLLSCERDPSAISTQELKQVLEQNATSLNAAVDIISSTAGFRVLTVSDDSKSASGDSIYDEIGRASCRERV